MRRYRIVHKTEYRYTGSVSLCHNEIRLKPRNTPTQTLTGFRLEISPEPILTHEREDAFGNPVHYLAVQNSHEVFSVVSTSEIQIHPRKSAGEKEITVGKMRELLQQVQGEEYVEMMEAMMDSPMVARDPELLAYGRDLFHDQKSYLSAVLDLTKRIFLDFKYEGGVTNAWTTVMESFHTGRGVCQDFAHIGVGVLRSLGFPARYVSGYLETLPPPGQPKLVGADASHAWFSTFVPGAGWFDFDPTNNIPTGPSHITTAWGRDYSDVPPIKGVIFGGGDHRVEVSVDVLNKKSDKQ